MPLAWLQEPVTIFTALLAVLVLLGLLFWRRRSAQPAPTSALESERDLARLVGSFDQSQPAFSSIMKSFQQRHSLLYLCRQADVKAAFTQLSRPQDQAGPSGPLKIAPGGHKPERVAAMVTILRAIYENDLYVRELPIETHNQLDDLLDTLTGGEPGGV